VKYQEDEDRKEDGTQTSIFDGLPPSGV